ncbi:f-box containing protein-like protein [Dermatophagoides farinae]|uniref:F-box containing protein-like protein n=2 Tax=Dermatophagoides farinae TaxID=6954 RepID=A0A9D4SLB8_DERFA|nr:f-box containing protein-like protein [Dermatophagoides farinae]
MLSIFLQQKFSIKIIIFIITIIVFEFIINSNQTFVPKGRKCRLQEMHCDIMHPEKQCCPGTSCGVKRINNNLVNICMMCLDIGESCGGNDSKTSCCRGLRCQKITALSNACIPVADFKFYPDYETDINVDDDQQRNNNSPQQISLASLLINQCDPMNRDSDAKFNNKQQHHQQQYIILSYRNRSLKRDLKFINHPNTSISKNNEYITNDHQSNIIDWKNLPLVILYKIFAYLSSTERLQASSTCNSWRNVIYHSTLWPQKHLKVNLCPHKFVLSENEHYQNQQQQQQQHQQQSLSYGFHTFRLQDSYLYQQNINNVTWMKIRNDNLNNRKPNRKNFNEQLKLFIQKCSRFLNGITFYFDPNSSHNVLDLIKIIKFLSENEVAIYEMNDNRQNFYANCRNLKYFSIIPVTTLVRCASDQRFMSLYSGLTEAIRFLFSKCNQLEHVSLGDLHELIHASDAFLSQFFKTGVHQKLQCLHLSSIKGDIVRYLPQQMTTLEHLEKFHSLNHLSLDFDVLNTKVISILSKIDTLQLLSINVHRFNRNHPGISSSAWSRIVTNLPNLSVNLNLLHTESNNFQIIIDSLLNTEMPIKHFKAYYLEFKDENSSTILCNMLEILSRTHMNTLESLTLIDHLNSPKNHLKAVTPNVLIMLCWRCRNLNNLTVIGYETTDREIIAMARLRGESLQSFYFPSCCIQLSEIFTKYNYSPVFSEFFINFDMANQYAQRSFRDAVSLPLKRNWQPIPTHKIPEIIATGFLPQTTYHRTILEQKNSHCIH